MKNPVRATAWAMLMACLLFGLARGASAQVSIVSVTPNVLYLDVSAPFGQMLVKLSGPAQGATAVQMTSSNLDVFVVPAFAVVPDGQSSTFFYLTPTGLGLGTLTATLGAASATAAVQVGPHGPALIGLAPDSITLPSVGGVATLQVALSDPADGVTTVALSSSAPQVVTVPSSVTISSGQFVASFVATSLAAGSATITATLGDVVYTASVQVGTQAPPGPAACTVASSAAASAAGAYATAAGNLTACTQSKHACKAALASARAAFRNVSPLHRTALLQCKEARP